MTNYCSVYIINILVHMRLMGVYEVAQLAGVSPQAVSNWIARRADFPAPMASLASGPVWNERHIRNWLVRAEYLSPNSTGADRRMEFNKGGAYTPHEISSTLGGEQQSYLPQREGRIVCGRFILKMNPQAPYIVLVGDFPKVLRKAELLAQQQEPIPVFIKDVATQKSWRYHGKMRCVSFNTIREFCESKALDARRTDRLAGVLTLKDAV
jgi:predicted DNA-binding transcriptional regulator AlpA